MPKGAGRNEGPRADPGEEQAAGTPHADIVERLLEYQRPLRELTEGETPTFGAVRDAPPPTDVEPDPAEPSAKSEPREPQPPAEAEPEPAAPRRAGFGTAQPPSAAGTDRSPRRDPRSHRRDAPAPARWRRP